MFFQKEIETMDRAELKALQLVRLQKTLQSCYDHVPLYREKFDSLGLQPSDIKSLADLKNVPFTTKLDIRDSYPFGMFAVPKSEVVRIHASSGTTGKPTVVGCTRNDLDMWSDIVARVCVMAGVTPEDTAQVAFGYGLFTGAFGLHGGLEKVGAMVVPMSSGNTEKQLMLMEDFGTTALIATPSYAVYLSEYAKEHGLTDRLKLKFGLLGAEGCTPEMRKLIEDNFGIFVTDNYGMSELIGPGVAGECSYREGMHLAEDHFIAEIIDPETEEVLPEGSFGELVITSITKEALPILRYRTRDMTRLVYEPCKCGRTHARIDKIQGRSDDMLIIKGVNVFPSQIESVLVGMEHIGAHYMLIVRSEGFMDSLEVQVELESGEILEHFAQIDALRKKVHHNLKSVLGLDAKVTLVQPKTFERSTGKAKRVTDLRKR